jgi:hypothetical protein
VKHILLQLVLVVLLTLQYPLAATELIQYSAQLHLLVAVVVVEYALPMVLNFQVVLEVLEVVVGIQVHPCLVVQELLVKVIVVDLLRVRVRMPLVVVAVQVVLVELELVLQTVLVV